jgi:hypothetical protein
MVNPGAPTKGPDSMTNLGVQHVVGLQRMPQGEDSDFWLRFSLAPSSRGHNYLRTYPPTWFSVPFRWFLCSCGLLNAGNFKNGFLWPTIGLSLDSLPKIDRAVWIWPKACCSNTFRDEWTRDEQTESRVLSLPDSFLPSLFDWTTTYEHPRQNGSLYR